MNERAELVTDVLDESVRIITKTPNATGRPAQEDLALRINQVMEKPGAKVLGQAGTGTGKSLAYLVPAAVGAVDGQRTVISTESLSLQAQIIDKDAPVVSRAVENLTGFHPQVAILKGWGNYVCAAAVSNQAEKLVGNASLGETTAKKLDALEDDEADLVAWAVRQFDSDDIHGDRHSYEGKGRNWSAVSVSSQECRGVKSCPFADMCKAALAKTRAAEADIVVTNHSLLAIQAAKGIPAVIGNKTLGEFQALVVDEAHGLPGQVRNQGAGEVSGSRLISLARGVGRASKTVGGAVRREGLALADKAEFIAGAIDSAIEKIYQGKEVLKLEEGQDPTEGFITTLAPWLTQATEHFKSMVRRDSENLEARRALSRIQSFSDDVSTAAAHSVGMARWVEEGSIKFSPVDVSIELAGALYEAPYLEGIPPLKDEDLNDDVQVESYNSYPMSVAMVSATLPKSFPTDVGIKREVLEYPSPFLDAYSNSALYVPMALNEKDVKALSFQGTTKFHTAKHAAWALEHILELVEASGGRALVLAAKAQDGKDYAEALRRHARGRWKVLDQWSDAPTRSAVSRWREDETAVLVGTKSLMTGTDAPGDTCRLVILDRVPRAPSNPVDDARVEKMVATIGGNKWTADPLVYGSDAALLLQQSAGRLIRQGGDRGMVAVLDPRLLKRGGSVFSYREPTRGMYMSSIGPFGHQIANLGQAKDFLRSLEAA